MGNFLVNFGYKLTKRENVKLCIGMYGPGFPNLTGRSKPVMICSPLALGYVGPVQGVNRFVIRDGGFGDLFWGDAIAPPIFTSHTYF